jgi:GNAT superfamily N-acetyltransferase
VAKAKVDIQDIEHRLWDAADELRANSHLKESEYSIPVLGLIFLKYADSRFSAVEAELESKGCGRRKVGKTDYQARGVMYLPPGARFANLLELEEGADLGQALNDAMAAVERENDDLAGLPLTATYGNPTSAGDDGVFRYTHDELGRLTGTTIDIASAAIPAPSSRPPHPASKPRPFLGPAASIRSPGSPAYTPPEQPKRPHASLPRPWTHASQAHKPHHPRSAHRSGPSCDHGLRNPGIAAAARLQNPTRASLDTARSHHSRRRCHPAEGPLGDLPGLPVQHDRVILRAIVAPAPIDATGGPCLEWDESDIESGHAIEPAAVEQFYATMYANRPVDLARLWRWMYRPTFLESVRPPLVMQHEGRVVAHAGMIPFALDLGDGEIKSAAWFVDFAVLPEHQGEGIGKLLTEAWMRHPDVCVTFCNDKSIGVFKKYGWVESFDTRLIHLFINPLNHPRIAARVPAPLRGPGNRLLSTAMRLNYKARARGAGALTVQPVTADTIAEVVAVATMPNGVTQPCRDAEYLKWRLLDAPDRGAYRVFSMAEDLRVVARLRTENPDSRHLDILWVTDWSQLAELKRLIALMAEWGHHNGFDFMRLYSSSPWAASKLSRALLGWVRHPRFAYFSKDPALLQRLEQVRWHFELMDSDFEWTGGS